METDDSSVTTEKGDRTQRRQRREFMPGLAHFYFGGNAFFAVIVLILISVLLMREAFLFFPENRQLMQQYRACGMEVFGTLEEDIRDYWRMMEVMVQLRNDEYEEQRAKGMAPGRALGELETIDVYIDQWEERVEPLEDYLLILRDDADGFRRLLTTPESADDVRPALIRDHFRRRWEGYQLRREKLVADAFELLQVWPPGFAGKDDQARFRQELEAFRKQEEKLSAFVSNWNSNERISLHSSVAAFLTGREWVTNSFIQDRYGLLPLLVGSLIVSVVALLLSVPFGIGAAIYVNMFASRREKGFLRSAFVFMAAIPSVLLGFFGVLVFGEWLRQVSNWEVLSWLPMFPIVERLNALTAGSLLALMAIPTVFAAAEDALERVPHSYKQASYAAGATRWQTLVSIMIPSSASGLVSSLLLGFSRVIGETMIVLLTAGNRLDVPEFDLTGGALVEPVHTMTGVIAQEMGEVVVGSLHYRSLFLVGLIIFVMVVMLNLLAQKIVGSLRLVQY